MQFTIPLGALPQPVIDAMNEIVGHVQIICLIRRVASLCTPISLCLFVLVLLSAGFSRSDDLPSSFPRIYAFIQRSKASSALCPFITVSRSGVHLAAYALGWELNDRYSNPPSNPPSYPTWAFISPRLACEGFTKLYVTCLLFSHACRLSMRLISLRPIQQPPCFRSSSKSATFLISNPSFWTYYLCYIMHPTFTPFIPSWQTPLPSFFLSFVPLLQHPSNDILNPELSSTHHHHHRNPSLSIRRKPFPISVICLSKWVLSLLKSEMKWSKRSVISSSSEGESYSTLLWKEINMFPLLFAQKTVFWVFATRVVIVLRFSVKELQEFVVPWPLILIWSHSIR